MRLLELVTILSTAISGFTSQEIQNTVYYYGGTKYFQQITTSPDGSYAFRIVLRDQQREEEGFYNSNGVWTIRGKVSWLNPPETKRYIDIFHADDKGYQVKSFFTELSPKESPKPTEPPRAPGYPGQSGVPGYPGTPSGPSRYRGQPKPPGYPRPPGYPEPPGYPGPGPEQPGYPGKPGPPLGCALASLCG